MVHWAWLILAIFAGVTIGVSVTAIFASGSFVDREAAHFVETQHLRDEIQYLQNKLTERGATING